MSEQYLELLIDSAKNKRAQKPPLKVSFTSKDPRPNWRDPLTLAKQQDLSLAVSGTTKRKAGVFKEVDAGVLESFGKASVETQALGQQMEARAQDCGPEWLPEEVLKDISDFDGDKDSNGVSKGEIAAAKGLHGPSTRSLVPRKAESGAQTASATAQDRASQQGKVSAFKMPKCTETALSRALEQDLR